KLLTGLYTPDRGSITVAGIDAVAGDPAALRKQIAVVFQDFLRYELPLRDNVGFGFPGATDDILLSAVRDAGGTAVLDRLERGWDTVLSGAYDGGTDLSGGQWQRVALARALAAVRAGAGVLILDEPTAALDVRAEVELFERLLSVARGITTILVSHRLSSVRHADRIVVVSDGRIAEDGSHAELLAQNGLYAQMFRLQAQRFTTGDADA
ncbi:MAG TPA: ABC transporter ATP-binding protein, partial [Mycobacteriales bacterium]|nr:ABC transporter ATP-binding protein [Mycobacteriales bacterium]